MGISSASQIFSLQPKIKGSVTERSRLSEDLLLKLQTNYFPIFRKSAVMKNVWCWSCRQGARCFGLPGWEQTLGCLCCCYLSGRLKLTQTSMVLACFENTGIHTRCWTCGKKWQGDAECGAHTAASFSWPCCAGSLPWELVAEPSWS